MLDKTRHVMQRMEERLRLYDIPFDTVRQEMQAIVASDWSHKKSYAVKVKDLGQFFGQSHGDYWDREESNGEVLWVIIRNNCLVTFFFRRYNQPSTAQRFSVDVITSAKLLVAEA